MEEPAFNRRSFARELAMVQVLEKHSAPEAVETIEATLNYIVNNG